ncbi:hypothetical protein KDU71_21255 [Carboxylicivirga sediminis]|uniref:Sensor of ECF-type sigma factor n=1 Tax=Carboxylicivirga sediminis TaxID=2006564 RepID=A0A941F844_9BACT|nr:hypothetical protein [Carboxylicivirga sediminis]MBR8538112.1 hypothetical protein [Carboxylicivirga sediminis]
MKTSLLLLMLTAFSAALSAQSAKEEMDYIQSIFGMEKKAMVAEVVQPDEANMSTFWTLYDSYETQRKALGQKRLELLMTYSEKYEDLTDEQAAHFLKETLAIKQQHDKLLNAYVKKVNKSNGPVTAMRFHQVEIYILSEIRVAIAGGLPFPDTH